MNNAHEILLSVIVPVYNVEQYIRSCIESIYKQGLSESSFEVIVVNDGTQDNSMEAIRDIIQCHANITIIEQTNQGLSVARNNGIAQAKGKYILMLDSDDLLTEGVLTPLLIKAVEHDVDIAAAEYLEMTNQEISLFMASPHDNQENLPIVMTSVEELQRSDMQKHICFVWRMLFRRDFLRENDLKFIPDIYYQDIPFTHECYLKARKCLKTASPLTIYRQRPDSVTLGLFDERHAHSYCTAIVSTWKLSKISALEDSTKETIEDVVYTQLSFQIYFLARASLPAKELVSLLRMIKKEAPDMTFTHGLKQRIKSFMFWHTPRLYTYLRLFYAKNVEDKGFRLL